MFSSPASRRRSALAFAACIAAVFAGTASANEILDWNSALLDSIRAARTNPPVASRQMAMLHASQYDAVNGILTGYDQYAITVNSGLGGDARAAAAQSGHRILSFFYPSRQAIFDTLLAGQLEAIPDGEAEEFGILIGGSVANAMLLLRELDGSAVGATYTPPVGAFWWTNTPPAFAPALLPNWGNVRPWTMGKGSQFRPAGPPPSPTSFEYFAAWTEVYLYGNAGSTTRDADQTEIALFWNDGAGTQTPPGHWCSIAAALATQENLSLHQTARLFALLGLAEADAAIASWDAKYAFHHWRPVTGIRGADLDGNSATFADASYASLITTPPFPSYTSGHSTFSGAASKILELYFGNDAIEFSSPTDGLPGVTREFTSISQAAEEAGQSRIYGGIHWQYDNRDGLAAGRALAQQLFRNYLRPIGESVSCVDTATSLCLGGRFKVEANWRVGAEGPTGLGTAVPNGGHDGRFWFFDANNHEVIVKVLDGCAINDRHWVFASGLTNVEVLITVTDTQSHKARTYYNPAGKAHPAVTDTDAFATCP